MGLNDSFSFRGEEVSKVDDTLVLCGVGRENGLFAQMEAGKKSKIAVAEARLVLDVPDMRRILSILLNANTEYSVSLHRVISMGPRSTSRDGVGKCCCPLLCTEKPWYGSLWSSRPTRGSSVPF